MCYLIVARDTVEITTEQTSETTPPCNRPKSTSRRWATSKIQLHTEADHRQAINLLEHLLQFEPSRRYDAHQAAAHPYFTSGPIAPPTIPSSVSTSTASLALPPRVAARASQASAAVQAQQAAQLQQAQQSQILAAQQHQYMMMTEQARQQQQATGYYGEQALIQR